MSVSKDMADPDLQIRGGGGGGAQKKIFWPFGPQSGLNIWGGGASPPGPSPGSISGTFWALKLVKPI